jgi:hypothetical protein
MSSSWEMCGEKPPGYWSTAMMVWWCSAGGYSASNCAGSASASWKQHGRAHLLMAFANSFATY